MRAANGMPGIRTLIDVVCCRAAEVEPELYYPPSRPSASLTPTSSVAIGGSGAPGPSRDVKPAKDVSQLIADKMLAGWALLDSHCPNCSTPLVRNRQRRMFCVSCDLWVIAEEDARKQQAEQQDSRAPAAPRAATSAPESGAQPVPPQRQLGTASVADAHEPLRSAASASLAAVAAKMSEYTALLCREHGAGPAADLAMLEVLDRCASVASKLRELL